MYRSLWIVPLIIILSLCPRVQGSELSEISVVTEEGRQVRLSSVVTGDSLLLLGFFACKHLCETTLKDVEQRLQSFHKRPKLVFLSVDEEEGPPEARKLRESLAPDSPWSLVTASALEIKKLTESLNFTYRRDPATRSIVHESALFFYRDGELDRKFSSFDFNESDLYGSRLRGMFYDYKQFCSEFDPRNSKYGTVVIAGLTAFSGVFVLAYGALFLRLRKKRK